MGFPSFEDFKRTLTEERLTELFSDMYNIHIYEMTALTQENISALVSNLSNELIGASVAANIRLLEAYHEWLSQDVSDQ